MGLECAAAHLKNYKHVARPFKRSAFNRTFQTLDRMFVIFQDVQLDAVKNLKLTHRKN